MHLISEKVVLLQSCKQVSMVDKVYFKQFDIEFVKLPIGIHEYGIKVDKMFFEKHPNDEILDADVDVRLTVEKKETLLRFRFHLKGNITLKCDVCLEDILHPIDIEESFVLKTKKEEEEESEDENMVYLPSEAYSYNVEQILYEMIYADVPMRKCHDDYPDQHCSPSMLDLLKKHGQTEKDKNETDPRWDALKNLKL